MPRQRDDHPRRIFLVGLPRSGTTLLQSLLFAHPGVVSFPETFFFLRITPWGRLRLRSGLARREAPEAVRALEVLDLRPRKRGRLGVPAVTVRQYARLFVDALDAAARAEGATAWLEKTPDHLKVVPVIERHVPDAHFVHLVRDGAAVVASMYELMRDRPEWRHERDPSIEEVVGIWRSGVRTSAAYAGRPRHVFVSYERLTRDLDGTLARLCAALGLAADGDSVGRMLADYPTAASRVVGRVDVDAPSPGLAEEPWKALTFQEVRNRNEEKLSRLFAPEEQRAIRASVAREQATLDALPFL